MHAAESNQRAATATIVIIIACSWLVMSPFVLGFTGRTGSLWVAFGVALVAAFVAGLRISGAESAAWLSWLNVLVGIALIVSPWVLGDADSLAVLLNAIVVGVVIAAASAWSALETRSLTSAP